MIGEVILQAASRPYWFVRRQEWNFKVVMTRRALSAFLQQLVQQYGSIYIVALGAGPVGLGTINSLGTGIGALVAVPSGWLVDRYSLKRVFVFGSGLAALVPILYITAPDWRAIVLAMLLFSIAMRLTGTGCAVVCAESLPNEDRATGKGLCNVFASISSLLAPAAAAFLITAFGGMTLTGLRSLYWVQLVGYGLAFLLIATQLQETEGLGGEEASISGFIQDFREVFSHGKGLKRWILASSALWLSQMMVGPFTPLFAHQLKGADQYVLAQMATASVAVNLVASLPLGRLADRIGRKRTLYLLAPFGYASILLLITARGSGMLVASGALQALYFISAIISGAITAELVPIEEMGRWSGILGLCRGLICAPAPLIGGMMWNWLGPSSLFIAAIAIDLLVRMPLLMTIPETLGGRR